MGERHIFLDDAEGFVLRTEGLMVGPNSTLGALGATDAPSASMVHGDA